MSNVPQVGKCNTHGFKVTTRVIVDSVLLAELSDTLAGHWVVILRHRGEKVVLDLIVEE